mmetsp:Transcript_18247/g.43810  ORF Transcript_18247/g.43810 Transcript_18247/m.43810 type:complete len:324 (-) Transcript_18247:66-1037(-)
MLLRWLLRDLVHRWLLGPKRALLTLSLPSLLWHPDTQLLSPRSRLWLSRPVPDLGHVDAQKPCQSVAITHSHQIPVQDPGQHVPRRLPVDPYRALRVHLAHVARAHEGCNVLCDADVILRQRVHWIAQNVEPCRPRLRIRLKLFHVDVQRHLLGPKELGGVARSKPVERVVHELHRKRLGALDLDHNRHVLLQKVQNDANVDPLVLRHRSVFHHDVSVDWGACSRRPFQHAKIAHALDKRLELVSHDPLEWSLGSRDNVVVKDAIAHDHQGAHGGKEHGLFARRDGWGGHFCGPPLFSATSSCDAGVVLVFSLAFVFDLIGWN